MEKMLESIKVHEGLESLNNEKEKQIKRGVTRMRPENVFLIIDFYEDRNKFRWIFPLAMLMLFIFIIFTIVIKQPAEKKEPYYIELSVEPANYQLFGKNQNNIRDPGIKIMDKNGKALSDINVEVNAISFAATLRNDRPKCDYDDRLANAGTYSAIRIFDICKYNIYGNEAKSNENGEVKFPKFSIERGPEGIYTFEYSSKKLKSNPITIFFQSEAFELQMMNSPQTIITEGSTFNPQPILKILNATGLPIKGKRVTALSWPEPAPNLKEGVKFLVQDHKYAILDNVLSEESNEEGIAVFNNLTLVGSMSIGFYIVFISDNSVMASWHYPPSMRFEIPNYPLLKVPIWLDLENYNGRIINIVNIAELPNSVMEGIALEPQPTIQLLNGVYKYPVPNIPVFAVLIGYEDDGVEYYFPRKFQYYEPGTYNKRLIKPIAAEYNKNYTDPFADWLYEPYLTDQNGEIQFNGLAFTTQGNTGNTRTYYVKFISHGEESDIYKVRVTTSISQVTFVEELDYQYYMNVYSDYEIFILLKILDANGNGVPGKSISSISFVDHTNTEQSGIILKAVQGEKDYSDSDGFLSSFVKIISISSILYGKGRIQISIDGLFAYSNEIVLWPSGKLSGCFHLRLIECPDIKTDEYIQTAGVLFTKSIKVLAIDNIGSPVSGVAITFTPLTDSYSSISNQPSPQIFFKLDDVPKTNLQAITDKDGYAVLDKLKPINAFFGTYFYDVIGKTEVSTTRSQIKNTCKLLKPMAIFIMNPLKFISVSSPDYDNYSGHIHNLNEEFTVEFRCFQQTMRNTQIMNYTGSVNIELDIYQLPPTLYTLWRDKSRKVSDYIVLVTTSPQNIAETDGGEINITMKVNSNYPGKWAIGVLFNGIHSVPVLFTTNMPVTDVKILQQPTPGDLIIARNVGRILPTFKIGLTAPESNFSEISYTVVAIAQPYNKLKDAGIIDVSATSLQLDFPSYIPIAVTRETQTDSSGIATFREITMMDVIERESCFKLKFYIGEPELSMNSEESNIFCYRNNYKISIMSKYSKIIGEEQAFKNKLSLSLTLTPVMGNDWSEQSMHVFTAVPASINGVTIPQEEALKYGEKYLSNNVCLFVQDKCLIGGCDMEVISVIRDKPLTINVYFDSLIWHKPTIQDTFTLRLLNYLPKANAPTTATITVTTTPTAIEVLSQPPKTVHVGDIFQIVVSATLGNGQGLPKSRIVGNLSQSINPKDYHSTTIDSVINLFGNQDLNIDSLSQLFQDNRIVLDKSRATAITDINGRAKMNLKLLSGKSGYYSIIFQSGGVKSSPTSLFYLQNPISKVIISNTKNFSQTLEVDFNQDKDEYIPIYAQLTKLPIIQIMVDHDHANYIQDLSDSFEIYIFDNTLIEEAKEGMEELGISTKNMTIDDIYKYSKHLKPSTPAEDMKHLWEAISKGAQTIGKIQDQLVDLQINFEPPTQQQNSTYNFTSISIEWKKPGKYRLIFVVLGIESELSPIITIVQAQRSTSEKAVYIFEYIFTYTIFVMAIIMNIAHINKYIKLATLFIQLSYLGVIHLTERDEIYQILTYISLGMLLLATLKSFIDEFFKEKETAHYKARERVFMEYAYQHLFRRVSKEWESRINIQNPKIHDHSVSIDSTSLDLTENTKIGINSNHGNEIDNFTKYESRGLQERIKWIIMPFTRNMKERVIIDAMYYPQRFIAPLLLGLVLFIYFSIILYNTVIVLIEKLDDLKIDIKSVLNEFLMSAITSGRKELNYEFSNKDFEKYYHIVDDVNEHLELLQFTLKLSIIIGLSLGVIITIMAFISIIIDFKLQIMKLRRGVCDIDYKIGKIAFTGDFPGIYISNCVIAFLIITTLFTLIGAIIFHKLFWELVWQYRMVIIAFMIPFIISAIQKLILSKLAYDKESDTVRRRKFSQFYEFASFFLLILGGVIASIARFFIGLVVFFIGMARLERPLMAEWFLRIKYLDVANRAYMSMLNSYHQFNNPIAFAFKECLFKSMGDKSLFILSLGEGAKDPNIMQTD